MKVKELKELCQEYLQLDDKLWGPKCFWNDNKEYWLEGMGFTPRGQAMFDGLEHQQDAVLEKLDMERLIDETDCTRRVVKIVLKVLEEVIDG